MVMFVLFLFSIFLFISLKDSSQQSMEIYAVSMQIESIFIIQFFSLFYSLLFVLVWPVLSPEHGGRGAPDQGDPLPVLHQPETIRWGGPRSLPGQRVRPPGPAQALAHADTKGSGALY